MKNLINQTFGSLTVIEKSNKKSKSIYYLCQCICGNTIEARSERLQNGTTHSCGCIKHTKHGYTGTRLYRIWKNMMTRCYNKNVPVYKNYGGRGITVDENWHDFRNFLHDMLPTYNDKLTLDRQNNDKNYTKENCRWTTYKVQCNNKRNNTLITIKNKTLTLQQWCDLLEITSATMLERIEKEWSEERLLLTNQKKRVIQ